MAPCYPSGKPGSDRINNVSRLYRYGFESPAGQLKLLIFFRMRR